MRLLDSDNDRSIGNVLIFLTRAEAVELRDSLSSLLDRPVPGHEHVTDDAFEKEITVCLYGEGVDEQLDERSRRLISEDK